MLIRRNTKAFKTIKEIIAGCQSRPDRHRLIRLYITKAGHSIGERISIEGIQGEAGLFYEMTYQAVLSNLDSASHQLHQSDTTPGIYFFRSSNKSWDETPFEFDEAIKKTFENLKDLPVLRKKEKAEKFVLPKTGFKAEPAPVQKEKTKKVTRINDKATREPAYKLRQTIHFTNLERIVIKNPRLSKKAVLDYYYKMAEYILPYLKDRPELIRLHSDGMAGPEYATQEALADDHVEMAEWIHTALIPGHKDNGHMLVCNDKEHLLFFIEIGCMEFNPRHSRIKSIEFPDYMLISIDSPEVSLRSVIEVALTAKDILSALRLPSFVKTDGMTALHVYVPLDSKSKFESSKKLSEYIAKLIRLKIPKLVALEGSDDNTYGKVSLNYMVNQRSMSVVAPYSLVPGASATVATPLLWEEVQEGLKPEEFNYETIFSRLKRVGDPFELLFKKKVNAVAVLQRIEDNYAFLF